MNTLTDLNVVFAHLTRAADEHADAHPAVSPGPAPTVDLLHPSAARSTRRPHRALVPATAAVLMLAAAIAGLVGLSPERSSLRPVHPLPPSGPVARTVGFTVDPGLGMTVARVQTGPTGVTVQLVDARLSADINLLPRGRAASHQGGQPLDVRGHAGWFVPGSRQTGVDSAGRPVVGRSFASVVWKYAPGRWVTTELTERDGTAAQLAPIARALDFTHPTPVRTNFKLGHAPAGYRLDSLDSTYLLGSDPAPDAGQGVFAATIADYVEQAGTSTIQIQVAPWGDSIPPIGSGSGERPVTVQGREAYWNAHDHTLVVRISDTAGLTITTEAATYAQTVILARGLAVAATTHPFGPSRWFDARTAIPV